MFPRSAIRFRLELTHFNVLVNRKIKIFSIVKYLDSNLD